MHKPNDEDIISVINLIKKESERFQNPIVTEIAGLTNDPFKVLISCLLSLRTKDMSLHWHQKDFLELQILLRN
jgi:endonuclease III